MGPAMSELQLDRGDDAALASAAERGRLSASVFCDALRAEEGKERRHLLARTESTRDSASEAASRSVNGDIVAVSHLNVEIEHLRQFRDAVLHSKGWRLLQLFRRLVGRAW